MNGPDKPSAFKTIVDAVVVVTIAAIIIEVVAAMVAPYIGVLIVVLLGVLAIAGAVYMFVSYARRW